MRIREKVWTCSSCGGLNKGRETQCPSCGNPREREERRAAQRGAVVADPELLRRALAGRDWDCRQCRTGNRADLRACTNCGSLRFKDAEVDEDPATVISAPAVPLRNRKAASAPPPLPAPAPPPLPPPPPPAPASFFRASPATGARRWAVAGVGAMLVFGLAGIGWLFQVREVPGTVTDLSWRRSIQVMRWADTTVKRWRHQTVAVAARAPVEGRGEQAGLALVEDSCRSEVFEYVKVQTGTRNVCEDIFEYKRVEYSCTKTREVKCGERCEDLDNGFEACEDVTCPESYAGTCTRTDRVKVREDCKDIPVYTDTPVYQDRCSYRTQMWVQDRVLELTGHDRNPKWPDFTPEELEKGIRKDSYQAVLSYQDGGPKQVPWPLGLDAYMQWELGAPVVLTVRNTGTVVNVMYGDRPK